MYLNFVFFFSFLFKLYYTKPFSQNLNSENFEKEKKIGGKQTSMNRCQQHVKINIKYTYLNLSCTCLENIDKRFQFLANVHRCLYNLPIIRLKSPLRKWPHSGQSLIGFNSREILRFLKWDHIALFLPNFGNTDPGLFALIFQHIWRPSCTARAPLSLFMAASPS